MKRKEMNKENGNNVADEHIVLCRYESPEFRSIRLQKIF